MAANPITDAREVLVDALLAAGLTAYGYTPPTVIPPAVFVEYGSPWLEAHRIGQGFSARVNLIVACVVNLVSSADSVPALDDLTLDVLTALPSGFQWVTVDQPATDSTGSQGETLRANITVTAQVKE